MLLTGIVLYSAFTDKKFSALTIYFWFSGAFMSETLKYGMLPSLDKSFASGVAPEEISAISPNRTQTQFSGMAKGISSSLMAASGLSFFSLPVFCKAVFSAWMAVSRSRAFSFVLSLSSPCTAACSSAARSFFGKAFCVASRACSCAFSSSISVSRRFSLVTICCCSVRGGRGIR